MITTFNCGSKDWVCLYPDGGYPGDMTALSYIYASNAVSYLRANIYQQETKYNLYFRKLPEVYACGGPNPSFSAK